MYIYKRRPRRKLLLRDVFTKVYILLILFDHIITVSFILFSGCVFQILLGKNDLKFPIILNHKTQTPPVGFRGCTPFHVVNTSSWTTFIMRTRLCSVPWTANQSTWARDCIILKKARFWVQAFTCFWGYVFVFIGHLYDYLSPGIDSGDVATLWHVINHGYK